VGDVDGVGAGEAERFVEPDQRVLGGFQVSRCPGFVTVPQLGTEQGEVKPCPRAAGAVPSLFRYQCGSAGCARSRAPRTMSAAGTRVRSAATTPAAIATCSRRLVRDPVVSGGVLAEMSLAMRKPLQMATRGDFLQLGH